MTALLPARPRSVEEVYGPIAEDLEKVEHIFDRALVSQHRCVSDLVAHLGQYRGKRLRPALLLLTARACGKVMPAHHVLGAVVEMIHTATLVHDDVLDQALMRRHVTTVNAGWGNQTSILLGDFLFTHAFHLASTVNAEACRLIGAATNSVCEGELQQTTEKGNLNLNEEEYLEILDGKTAALTACSCELGALYSQARPEVVHHLARYGRWLGIAFQIADDILDLVGEERATGKSLGTDLAQQKLTLPLIHLFKEASPSLKGRLREILESPGNHKQNILRPFLADHGSLDYSGRRALDFATRARTELDSLPTSPCRTILENLADRVVHRNW